MILDPGAPTATVAEMRAAMQELHDSLGEPQPETDSTGSPQALADFTARAGAAFERTMQPVCTAIVGALQADDLDALKGLRALLPHLLREVNRDPVLGDLLAYQLGRELLAGFTEGSHPAPTP